MTDDLSSFAPLGSVVALTAVVAVAISPDVLFSYTFLFGGLFLAGVVAACYAGTTLALERFFGRGGAGRRW